MPSDRCPYAPRIAARLADPAARLDADLAQHLPQCEACRRAASAAIRAWPTDRSPSPSLAEWLGEPTGHVTILSQFQADAIAGGRPGALELGPYLLLDRLGTGGMGEVYRGWHRLLRREDAVKTVRAELAAHPGAVKRFLREAEAAAKVRHPNVVHVYAADRAAGGYYIAMEFVPGTDLGKLVRAGGPLAPAVACDYLRQAADGLHHAFASGLVHRDVKPANLLVTEDRRTVKVADFGLARALEGEGVSEMTASGTVLGTTDYVAPEQAEDARSADTRADVYALGCTLFFLLTGDVPFPGGSVRNKLERHAIAPVPDVTATRPDVPPAVGAIVTKCMAKRPADRYQTPGELAAALRAIDRAVPAAHAAVQPPTVRTTGVAPHEKSTVAMSPAGPAERKPKRVWIWAGAALLLTVVVVVTVMMNWPRRYSGGDEGAKGDPRPDAPGVTPPNQPGPKEPAPPTPPAKPPAGVPLPKGVGEAPWKFTAACWSERKDKVRAVGFLADRSICAGREGSKKGGSDSAYWEVWPKTGGAAIRSHRPAGTADYEYPLCVYPGGLVTDRFRRFDPTTFKPLAPLSTDVTAFDRGQAEGLDVACATGNGKFVVGTVVPAGERRTIRLVVEWDADTGKVRTAWQVKTPDDLKTIATDHTGDTVATATREGKFVVVSTRAKGTREWAGPNVANEVALSPDGKKLYSAHRDERSVLVWTVADTKREAALPVEGLVLGMTVSPNGRWLAAVGEVVAVWDLEANPPTASVLAEHWAGDLMSVAFGPDSRRLAVGGWARRGEPPEAGEGVVWLWDLKP